jgi:hypothetical protein
MESVDAKMIRAHEQIDILHLEIREFLSTIKVEQVLKTSPSELHPWLVMWVKDYIPPPGLSVLMGECVHNMSGALDNLVCGLARTVNPLNDYKKPRIAFPFTKEEKNWKDKLLEGVPSAALTIIKTFQPWHDPFGPKPNPLSVLNELSNTDKHRACNFTLVHSRNVGVEVHGNDGTVIKVQFTVPFYLGNIEAVSLAPMTAAAITPSARVITTGAFVLTLQEEGIWNDLPIERVLERCFEEVEEASLRIARMRQKSFRF